MNVDQVGRKAMYEFLCQLFELQYLHSGFYSLPKPCAIPMMDNESMVDVMYYFMPGSKGEWVDDRMTVYGLCDGVNRYVHSTARSWYVG